MAEGPVLRHEPRGWRKIVPQPLRLMWRQMPLLFSYPKNRIEEEAVDYDAYWQEKRGADVGALSPFQLARANEICELIEPNSSVLDIGCGDGAILKHLKKELNIEAWGVDQSSLALEAAKGAKVQTIQADLNETEAVQQLPEVDYITALEVLEHVPSPEPLLRALAPKCKKAFIVSVPNSGYWLYRLRLLCGRMPAQWRRHPGEHLRFWTLKDIRWWVRAMGWNLECLRCYEGLNGLNKLLPSWCAMGMVLKIKPGVE